jgi:hypothetical protein
MACHGQLDKRARGFGSAALFRNETKPISGFDKEPEMKTAKQILDEIVLTVQPPRGVSVAITERPGDQNWVAGVGPMNSEHTIAFSEKVASLAKTDPIIDWSAITERDGEHRRIAGYLSEVLSDQPGGG